MMRAGGFSPAGDLTARPARPREAAAPWLCDMGGKARLAISDPADIVDFRLADDGRRVIYHVGATRTQIAAAEKRAYDEGALVDPTVDVMQPFAGGAIVDGKRSITTVSTWGKKQSISVNSNGL